MSGRASAIWAIARDPTLRRLQLSFAGFALAENATWLAVLVYAFAQGGVREAGLVAIVMLAGAVVVAPFAAFAGDRYRPGAALAVGFAVQAITMGATAAAMWAGMPIVTYVAATVVSAAVTFTRPVVAALLPTIARRPSELIAANVLVGAIGDVGLFVGPLIAAVMLAGGEPAAVFAVFAVLMAASALLVAGLTNEGPRLSTAPAMTTRALWIEISGGLVALRRAPTVTAIVAIMAVAAITAGVVEILAVAFSDVRLDGGGSQAGILVGGAGLGAIAGSLGASGLIGGSRLTPFLLVSGVVLSVPFTVLAGVGHLLPAVALFALVGTGQSLMRVTGMVAIQRLAPGRLLSRIVGVLESVQMLAMAAGSAVVAVLIDVAGIGVALVAFGGAVLALFTLGVAWLVRVGGVPAPPPTVIVERVLADPVLTHLEVPAMERVAADAATQAYPAGTTVVAEGDAGTTYYMVITGELTVTRRGRVVRRVGPGGAFGELALLHAVPRTATVTCDTDAELLVVSGDTFVEAVTGHPTSLAAVSDVTADYVVDE